MKKIWICALGLLCVLVSYAQDTRTEDIQGILRTVEQNNIDLQALRQLNRAAGLDVEFQNMLTDPTVEYSPFFQNGVGGVASSEFILRQSFDFPTLYLARNKSTDIWIETLELQYQGARQDILLQAKQLCLDLIYQNQVLELLQRRMKNAESLRELSNKRLEKGAGTLLDVNKVKMELMKIQSETVQAETARQNALESLRILNGNQAIEFDSVKYEFTEPAEDDSSLYNRIVAEDYGIRTTQSAERVAYQNVKISKQGWLPKLDLGYRRNTSMDEESNGFLVGISIPLFSPRNRIKAAQAQYEAARLQGEQARILAESQSRSRINEMRQLQSALDVYDPELMNQMLELLRSSLEKGEISMIDYYTEADGVYQNLQNYMNLSRQYQGIIADIYKFDL